MNNKYKVGDSVVHLSHGVGIIKGIETREFNPDKPVSFYIIEIQDNGAPKKVFVPFGSEDQRLRPIVKQAALTKIYKNLSDNTSVNDSQTWNMRYRVYMEEIHSGDALKIATVLRSLATLAETKDLSFGERKLMDQAKTLLVKELALVENKSENEIEEKIAQLLHN